MTHRQARRKLGSRTTRRGGTSGKSLPGSTSGKNAKVQLRRNPQPTSRRVAVGVRTLVKKKAEE